MQRERERETTKQKPEILLPWKNSLDQEKYFFFFAIFTTVCEYLFVRMLSTWNVRVRIVVKLCHTFFIAFFFWSFVYVYSWVPLSQLNKMLLSNGDENCVTKNKFFNSPSLYKIRFFFLAITFTSYTKMF